MAQRGTTSLRGKTVAITGGARAIGRAAAAAFATASTRVAIGDLDVELAEKAAAEIANHCGGNIFGLALDVTQPDSFATFLDDAEKVLGLIDVLVNNAGIMPTGSFVDEADALTDRIIDVNLRGVVTGSRLAARRFLPRGSGTIVNVASLAGVDPEDVAEAMVTAVDRGKFRVAVPARLGVLLTVMSLLPRSIRRWPIASPAPSGPPCRPTRSCANATTAASAAVRHDRHPHRHLPGRRALGGHGSRPRRGDRVLVKGQVLSLRGSGVVLEVK